MCRYGRISIKSILCFRAKSFNVLFGNGSVLANGLDFQSIVNGVTTTEDFLLQNNADLAIAFTGTININTYNGTSEFFKESTLRGDQGDLLRIVVQDDVTSADFLQFSALFWIQV